MVAPSNPHHHPGRLEQPRTRMTDTIGRISASAGVPQNAEIQWPPGTERTDAAKSCVGGCIRFAAVISALLPFTSMWHKLDHRKPERQH